MPSPLENPFRPPIPTVVDYEKEAHAIGLLLGPKAEAAYRKRHAHDLSDPSASVSSGLTAEEQAQMNEKPESMLAHERKEQIRAAWEEFFASNCRIDDRNKLIPSLKIYDDGSVALLGGGKMILNGFDESPPVFPTVIREFSGLGIKLSNLKSAMHLVLPLKFRGTLNLDGLESAEHLVLPSTFTGDLKLSGLRSAEHLILPPEINGALDLGGLESAEHLILPVIIANYLDLYGLTSAKHLVLPKSVGGEIYFKKRNLPQSEFDKIRASRPDLADKMKLE